ncbi:MAG: carbonic anhydrase [Coriobacteriaceae bacterium]|jgi:carbonic anhydrase|nr:carbonic anhydrase [Coriobacteriaceae bacterium]
MKKESAITNVLNYNKEFVAQRSGEIFEVDGKPRKQLALVACMDTRFTSMLMAALGLEDGDVNVIKVAGAEVSDAYGAVMRSLLVAVYELGVREIMVVAHTECGAQNMNAARMTMLMQEAGVEASAIEEAAASGINLDEWLEGFGNMSDAVLRSVATIQNHPLAPSYLNVRGFVIETQTGELFEVS